MTTQATPQAAGATLHLGGDAYCTPDLQPLLVPIDQLHPFPGNARRGDQDAITGSVRDLGVWRAHVVQGTTGHVLVGNHQLRALLDLGATHAPASYRECDDDTARAIAIRDNHTSDLGTYDQGDLLALYRATDQTTGLELAGLTSADLADLERALAAADYTPPVAAPTLAERFVVPPFTVLDARSGPWQERKRRWLALGIQSEVGRGSTAEGQVSEKWNRDRKTLGAVQTNLDGEDAARYGRPDTRGHSRGRAKSFTADGSLERIRPGAEQGRTLGQGLQAHRGPDGDLVYTETTAAGVSIFDPVLCELAYRWFTPPGGHVLDPFAGGSVRGIVAASLGLSYTGIELRPEQVAANQAQLPILDRLGGRPRLSDTVEVKVSAASARQEFHGCEPDYIKDVCHGRCCRSPQASTGTGTMITIHPTEQAAIEAQGGTGGLLQPREGEARCPFQDTGDHLCGLHNTPDKPFGCIASPFTLNSNGTLIIRNRYRQLCCYKDTREDGTQLPAYVAFRASLDLIFGSDEAQRIHDHLAAGGGDLVAVMPRRSHRMLTENDAIKHGHTPATRTAHPQPSWLAGDSREVLPASDTPPADLLFSCPPYADLEVYSDDPADLSNMPYDEFLAAYRTIIAAALDRLRPDRYAVWVIGEVRDRRGLYRGLVPDTIRAFTDAGAALYNEAVLVTPVGSLPIRAGRQFTAGRKLGKTHQNVLVFCKGDPRAAADACGTIDVSLPDVEEDPDA